MLPRHLQENILAFVSQDMNTEPVSAALREVAETKILLEALLVSSESFDYPKAKLALKALQQKVRDLTKLQAKLEKEKKELQARVPKIFVLDFKQPLPAGQDTPPPQ